MTTPALDPIHRAVLGPDPGWVGPTPDRARIRAVVAEAAAHRTTGWLAWAVGTGALDVPEDVRAEVLDRHAELMAHALLVESELVRLHELLPDRTLVFKGVAAAHLDHPEPSLRAFQDVDLLVHPDDVDEAVASLVGLGCRRDLPPRRRDWDRRFAKDIPLVTTAGVELDLHRMPVPGPYGFGLDLDELHAASQDLHLGAARLRAPDRARRAVVAALALTVGEAEPRAAAALDLVAALDDGPDEAIGLAERWRVAELLAEAIRWADALLGPGRVVAEARRWAAAVDDPSWLRRAYRSGGGTNAATLLAAPIRIRGVRARIAYLRGLVVPDRAYRDARRRAGRPREARTALGELLGRRR